jgi:hypothetical protein
MDSFNSKNQEVTCGKRDCGSTLGEFAIRESRLECCEGGHIK